MVGVETREAAAVVAILRRNEDIVGKGGEGFMPYNLNPRINLLRRRDKDAGKKG